MPDISISDLPLDERSRSEILSPEALAFLAELHGRFDARRLELLGARRERRAEIAAGGKLDFLPETREIREDSSWQAAPPREDYADRRVEIIGPTDRKLVIDASELRRQGLYGRLRGRQLADLARTRYRVTSTWSTRSKGRSPTTAPMAATTSWSMTRRR